MIRRASPPRFRNRSPKPTRPISLSDAQLQRVMIASTPLSSEKRLLLLERIAAKLDLHGPAFTGGDLDGAIASALTGLIASASGPGHVTWVPTRSGETVQQKTVVRPWCR